MGECRQCGECCRWLAFTLKDMNEDRVDYYKARGAIVEGDTVIIPHICQHLGSDNCCAIHKDKPVLCAAFVGQSKGYIIPPGCGYAKKDTGE